MKLARQLIGHQSSKTFDAASYVDEFKGRVEAAIQKKVEGKEISLSQAPAAAAKTGGNVIDLMDMLRASLESRGCRESRARAETSEARACEARGEDLQPGRQVGSARKPARG